LLLLLMFLGAALASFLGSAIAQFVLGIPMLEDPTIMADRSDPSLIPVLRLLQILQSIGMLMLPGAFVLWKSEGTAGVRALFAGPRRQAVLLCLAVFPVLIPFVHFSAEMNTMVPLHGAFGDWAAAKEAEVAELTLRFMDMPHTGWLLFNLMMIAVLPAVGEELLFRGIVQRLLARHGMNVHLAVWVAAILFSAIHVQFLSFLPRVLMGVVLGYLLVWGGNLWYPIIAHFANNAAAVMLYYASQHGLTDINIENPGGGGPVAVMFSLAFGMMLLYLFKVTKDGGGTVSD
jgi:membrane protease YdiL (CAAX protease family)